MRWCDEHKIGGDCCKNIYLFLLELFSLSLSPSPSLSLQTVSLFYNFTTYSNDSEIFSKAEIIGDGKKLFDSGAFSMAGVLLMTILANSLIP